MQKKITLKQRLLSLALVLLMTAAPVQAAENDEKTAVGGDEAVTFEEEEQIKEGDNSVEDDEDGQPEMPTSDSVGEEMSEKDDPFENDPGADVGSENFASDMMKIRPMAGAVVNKEVTITSMAAGGLEQELQDAITDAPSLNSPADIISLSVEGTMNGSDFAYIRTNLSGLVNLDLSEITNATLPNLALYNSNNVLDFLETVKLPSALNEIGDSAFYNCNNLKQADISNVTMLGNSVFYNCQNLGEVDMSNVTALGTYAFWGCTSMTIKDGMLHSGLVEIPQDAFVNCESITKIDMSNVETLGSSVFSGCRNLTLKDGRLNSNLTEIPSSVFYGCESLDAIDLSNVTQIGLSAFYNCKSLETADLSNAGTVSASAFYQCEKLWKVTLSPALKKLEMSTFYGCSALREINLENVEQIGAGAFRDCKSLMEVDLSSANTLSANSFNGCEAMTIKDGNLNSDLTEIPQEAFSGCKSLSIIDLSNITKLNARSFYNCEKLRIKDGELNSGLTEIPAYTFYGCKSLDIIDLSGITELNTYSFYNCESIKIKNGILNSSLTEIPMYAFSGCKSLTIIDLSNITKLNTRSFYDCASLEIKDGNLNSSLTEIPAYTFYGCASLTKIDLSDVTTLGDYAFRECESLTDISLENITTPGTGAFYDCKGLITVTLSEQTTSLGMSTFYGCESLTGINLSNVETLSNGVFRGCESLAEVDISKVTVLGTYTFYNCTKLTLKNNALNSNLTNIPSSAFSGCEQLIVDDLANVKEIGSSAFFGCISLAEIDLQNAETLGGSAFQGCIALTAVYLPNANTLGNGVFYECTSLSAVDISGAEKLGDYCFYNCSSLQAVALPDSQPTFGSSVFYNVPALLVLIKNDQRYDISNLPDGSDFPVIKGEITVDSGAVLSLSVVPEGGSGISYQWYKGSQLLDNQNDRNLVINNMQPADQGEYECRVTLGSVTNTTSSSVRLLIDAQKPVITLSPEDVRYMRDEAASPLKVGAKVDDNGELSYQWYYNTVPINAGGIKIEQATQSAYTPPTDQEGIRYYYAEVTNKNENVSGLKEAKSVSNVAKVTVVEEITNPGGSSPERLPAAALSWDGDRTLTVYHDQLTPFSLLCVKWDGVVTTEYNAYQGSVVIRFNEDFIARQNQGEHTVRVEFVGYYGEITVTTNKSGNLLANESNNKSTGNKSVTVMSSQTKNPKTNDMNEQMYQTWMILSAFSFAMLAALLLWRRKDFGENGNKSS